MTIDLAREIKRLRSTLAPSAKTFPEAVEAVKTKFHEIVGLKKRSDAVNATFQVTIFYDTI